MLPTLADIQIKCKFEANLVLLNIFYSFSIFLSIIETLVSSGIKSILFNTIINLEIRISPYIL